KPVVAILPILPIPPIPPILPVPPILPILPVPPILSVPSALRQEVFDGDEVVWPRERGDAIRCRMSFDGGVAPAGRRAGRRLWIAVDLDDLVDEIHNPVVGEAGARIDTRFSCAVEFQR